ncbi:MAG: TAT-variant-translocated molybdopterin oxidoreductase [Verrucomicrobia bacterium]|nr:TAT-variant-translocated molybdopterin oxidoreductase [Verrucomicrobiota bacterium]
MGAPGPEAGPGAGAGAGSETGRTYWRSLEHLADAPEFRLWAEREFPVAVGELADPVSRRHFVRIMSASFMLAGLGLAGAGCRRPVEKIYPFSRMPENYYYGVPQFYATAMPTRAGAMPLVVKSNDGRPTKIEGNALHPDSNGGTDTFAQASVLSLYDPDRARRFTKGGNDVSAAAALDFLAAAAKGFAANGGEGLCFLLERNHSPSRARLQSALSRQLPKARWFVHEPVDFDIHRQAASQATGKSVTPYWRLDQAKTIVSLDCDFIGTEGDRHRLIRGFAQGRKISQPGDPLSRLYVIESLLTLTGINADHRLRRPSGAVLPLAAQLAAEVLRQRAVAGAQDLLAALEALGKSASADAAWIKECAADLVAHGGDALVLAGYRQPLAVHVLALAMNAALGSVGRTLVFHETPPSQEGSLAELAEALHGGRVDTLVMIGGNPGYTAPAELDWTKTQRLAKTVLRLGYYEDETFPACDWHLPLAHYLESWGDARTSDGTLVPIQPLIEPLFGGLTELEVLARLGGLDKTRPYDIARETFRGLAGEADFEERWKKFLHDGLLADSAAKPVQAALDWSKTAQLVGGATPMAVPTKDQLEVVLTRDYSVDDGRYNNNGWLQEMPDPVTKMTWDNAVLMSRKTAAELGLANTEVVEITLGQRTVRGPVWIQPGMADHTLGLALGYGRDAGAGRVGRGTGFNAYRLRTTQAEHIASGATVRGTGQQYPISCTQDHWSMEGRPIIREMTVEEFQKQPGFAKHMGLEAPPSTQPLYPNPLEAREKTALYQWGMSIDLNSCVGCSACMMACQSENNVPIVGKVQVSKGREMHWIRLDRYYAANPAREKDKHVLARDQEQWRDEWIDDPQAVTQPMLCQMCEAAPCENVCPVNATVHNDEGLNLMVYNRCVGTRYCSNNCPYKVRRFNYFDYNKRPLDKLYRSPLDPFYRTDGQWELLRWLQNVDQSNRPADEWELLKLVRNPDVTVRMRGVMEKCNYCLQRIERAKIAQKVKARDSGNVRLTEAEGTIPKTACQQACPAEAIVFGDISDPHSRVSRLKGQQRDYQVLDFLHTKPRTTYLAKVRNPNPRMPDTYASPSSTLEFLDHNGPLGGEESPPKGES